MLTVDSATHTIISDNITLAYNPPYKFISKSGGFNLDSSKTAGQTIEITGLGFTPKIIFFFWTSTTGTANKVTANTSTNIGWGVMNNSGQRACVTSSLKYANVAVNNNYSAIYNAQCIAFLNYNNSLDGLMDYYSINKDGFTIVVDDQLAGSYRVQYMALAGTDLTDTYIAVTTSPTATGNHDVTAPGFQPDAAIFGSVASAGVNTITNNAMLNIGMATSSTSQGVSYIFAQENVQYANTKRYGYNGECISAPGQSYRESFVSFLSNGFRLNRLEGTGSKYYLYVCLKGGSYDVGEITTRTDANSILSYTDFNPYSILFVSSNYQLSTQNTLTNDAKISIGTVSSGSAAYTRNSVAIYAETGLSFKQKVDFANYQDEVYSHVYGSAIQGLMDLSATSPNNFTTVMDDVDPSANWVSFLAMGPTKIINNAYNAVTSDNITLTLSNPISIDSCVLSQTSDNIALSQKYSLSIESSSHAQTSDNVTLSGGGLSLLVFGSSQNITASNIILQEKSTLSITNCSQAHLTQNIVLAQKSTLTINAAVQLQSSSNISLLQKSTLTINAAVQLQSSSNISLLQKSTLTVSNVVQLQNSSNIILQQKSSLTVNNCLQQQTSSNTVLTQRCTLIIGNAYQGISSGKITLLENYVLLINNASQTHQTSTPVLIYHQYGALIISDSIHTETSQNVQLLQHQILQTNSCSQIQTTAVITLFSHYFLLINNSAETQTVENIILFAHYGLIINNALQAQSITSIGLSSHYIVTINSILQTQTSTRVSLSSHYSLTINNSLQTQNSSKPSLSAYSSLVIGSSSLLQTSTKLNLSSHYALVMRNSSHIQTSSKPALSSHYILSINSSSHLQTSSKPVLTYHGPVTSLTIQNCIQLQACAAGNWWTIQGVNTVAAYQPKGASSFANSKVNIANPGTHDATNGIAYPTWDAVNGWSLYQDSKQYLNTDFTPNGDYTVIVRYSADASAQRAALFGAQNDYSDTYHIWAVYEGTAYWRNGGSYNHSEYRSGVIGLVGHNAYMNGTFLSTIGTGTQSFANLRIGAFSTTEDDATDYYWWGTIQALVIYDSTLTTEQVTYVTAGINSFTAPSLLLTQHLPSYTLSVQNSTLLQTADKITRSVIPSNSYHTQFSDNVDLVVHHFLGASDCIQQITSDNIQLVYYIFTERLEVNNCYHTQTSSNIIFSSFRFPVIPNNTNHLQTSSSISLKQHHVLSMKNAVHTQTSTSPVLWYHVAGAVTLTVRNCLQATSSDKVSFTTHLPINVNNAAHRMRSSKITFVIEGMVSITPIWADIKIGIGIKGVGI